MKQRFSIYQALVFAALLLSSLPTYAQIDTLLHKTDTLDIIVDQKINRLDTLNPLQASDTLQQLRSALAQKFSALESTADLAWLDSLENKASLSPAFLSKWDSLKSSIQDTTFLNLIGEYERHIKLPKVNLRQLDKLQSLQQKITGQIRENTLGRAGETLSSIKEYEGFPQELATKNYENLTAKVQNVDQITEIREVQQEVNQAKDIDNYASQKAQRLDEVQALNEQKEKVPGLDEAEKYINPSFMKRRAAQKAYMTVTEITPDQAEKLQGAMEEMKKLKKKYYAVDNSKDVAEGIEKPIKGKPINNHWVFGGNFQMIPGRPLSMDLSPLIGYQINSKWMVGAGASWRYAFDESRDYKPPRREDMIYGFNVFNQYLIRKSFFIHVEWQKTSEPANREFDAWNNSLLGGIGRYFSLGGKARGNMIVFYDFLGDKDKPFNQRFRVKFGFMFGGN